MKFIKANRGWKFETPERTYYIGEFGYGNNGNEGVIYLDEDAFERGEGVCYIPEYGFENESQNGCELFEFYAKEAVGSDIENNPYTASDDTANSYTKQTFLDICFGNEAFARELFNAVDWQSPETLWDEWLEDDDFYQTVKEWCDEHNIELN